MQLCPCECAVAAYMELHCGQVIAFSAPGRPACCLLAGLNHCLRISPHHHGCDVHCCSCCTNNAQLHLLKIRQSCAFQQLTACVTQTQPQCQGNPGTLADDDRHAHTCSKQALHHCGKAAFKQQRKCCAALAMCKVLMPNDSTLLFKPTTQSCLRRPLKKKRSYAANLHCCVI